MVNAVSGLGGDALDSKTFVYNGFSAPLDCGDYKVLERIENAYKVMTAKTGAVNAKTARSVQVKEELEAVKAFADAVLGEGAGDAVIGDSTNQDDAINFFMSLKAFRDNQERERLQRVLKFLPDRGE